MDSGSNFNLLFKSAFYLFGPKIMEWLIPREQFRHDGAIESGLQKFPFSFYHKTKEI